MADGHGELADGPCRQFASGHGPFMDALHEGYFVGGFLIRSFPTGCSLCSATMRSCCCQPLRFLTELRGRCFGSRLFYMAGDNLNKPNQPTAGKAGIARRLAIEHLCPGLPEPGRSATRSMV